ncbi:MAG: hypothetical protein GY714_32405 [Desulfobacterales bacterium]|nr:hypothetical protein [Desulfobacterales bacterium]
MFTMTYNEAMVIQRAQLVYYRNLIGRAGVKKIRAMTKCPVDINPSEQMRVSEINALVPRGGSIESLVKYKPGKKSCPNSSAWHDAIRKGYV